jgi:hypothetical protein
LQHQEKSFIQFSAYPRSSTTLITLSNLSYQADAIRIEIKGEDLSFLFPSSFERSIDSGPNHLCWFRVITLGGFDELALTKAHLGNE